MKNRIIQIAVVTDGDGVHDTLYALDSGGNIWCRASDGGYGVEWSKVQLPGTRQTRTARGAA